MDNITNLYLRILQTAALYGGHIHVTGGSDWVEVCIKLLQTPIVLVKEIIYGNCYVFLYKGMISLSKLKSWRERYTLKDSDGIDKVTERKSDRHTREKNKHKIEEESYLFFLPSYQVSVLF